MPEEEQLADAHASAPAHNGPVTPDTVGAAGELHQNARGNHGSLTNNQGLPVTDDENSLKAGPRGPVLLEDFILREKNQPLRSRTNTGSHNVVLDGQCVSSDRLLCICNPEKLSLSDRKFQGVFAPNSVRRFASSFLPTGRGCMEIRQAPLTG